MMDKDHLLNSELSCNAYESPFSSMISSTTTTFTAVATTTVAASSYMLPNNDSCCNSTSTSSFKLHWQSINHINNIANMGDPVPLPTTPPPLAAGPGFPARPFKTPPGEKSPVSEQIPHQETCFQDSNAINLRKRKMKLADGRISAKEFAGDKARENGDYEDEREKRKWNEKEYIHVRARRGEATDRHSVAERARRENINKKMKLLQDLVPGCNKAIGKAVMLDETINYVESLQRQVQFLSMKLAAVNPGLRLNNMTFQQMYSFDSSAAASLSSKNTDELLRQSPVDPVHMDDNLGVQFESSVDGFSERLLQQFPEEDEYLHSIIQNRVNFRDDDPTWGVKGWL